MKNNLENMALGLFEFVSSVANEMAEERKQESAAVPAEYEIIEDEPAPAAAAGRPAYPGERLTITINRYELELAWAARKAYIAAYENMAVKPDPANIKDGVKAELLILAGRDWYLKKTRDFERGIL